MAEEIGVITFDKAIRIEYLTKIIWLNNLKNLNFNDKIKVFFFI